MLTPKYRSHGTLGKLNSMQATLYVEKAQLFAKSRFVVGYDTAIRLVMPKYYGGHTNMLLELAALHYRGCKFLVAGRAGDNGEFLQLRDVKIPGEISDKVSTLHAQLQPCSIKTNTLAEVFVKAHAYCALSSKI